MTGSGNGGQGLSEGTDSEDAERCPICLGVLVRGDLAMPNSCCHVFCLGCLLTWAESQTVPSCPVDRRPFDSIYKWDRALGCVQIPVRRRTNQSENKKCFCRDPEPNPCLKSKQVARLRRQKPERASDTKSKGLVRKCSDEDPSSINRKKVRGTPCCTWSPSTFGSLLSSLTQDTVEPHWVPEDMSYESGYRQCKRQTQDCPWLTPAAPIAANGISRHSFHPSSWNHSPFPLRPFSSPFSSTTQFGSGHFVFQGRVCAVTCPKGGGVTCPKGGEKRGGRASGSKAAPTKDAQPVASRRSGRRSSRGQEAAAPPAEESAASQPSQSSDSSDSSAGQPSKPAARVSQAAAKKKGKQVTNRKASGKRKAPAKKRKVSPQVLSSPAASEEEEEEEGGNKEEKEEEEDEVDEEKQISELQHSDVEASPKRDHNGSSPAHEEEATGAPPLSDGSSPEDEEDATRPLSDDAENERDDETREQSPAAREEKNGSSMSSSPANSCQMSPVGDQSEIAEERPDSPVPSEDNGSEPYSPVPSEEKGSEHPDSPVPSEENGSEPDSPVPSEEKGSEPDSPVPSEENGSEHPDSPVRSEEKGSEPDSPVPSEEKGSDGVPSPLPSNSHNGPAESPQSPHSGQEAEDDAMEVCADSPEGNDEASTMKIEESGSSPHPESPSTRDAQQKVHDAGDAEEDSKSRMPESQERPSDERAKEGSKEDNLSQDDTNVIPMDCSSPASDHGDNLIEPQSDDAADRPTGTVAPAPPPASQVAKEEAAGDKDNKEAAGDKDNKGRRERERSPDRKNGKQRRSRFHSPSSTYKRDSGRQEASSRRSRSRSRERTQDRDGSPPSRRSSRGRSRDGERDKERNDSERDSDRDRERDRERDGGDRDRDHSRRERSRERRRRRSRSRSRSRSSRSRSGSRSRTRSHRRGGGAGGPSPNRRSPSEDRSPQRKERGSRGGGGGSWRSAQPGSDSSRRNPPSSDHLPARGGGAGTGGGRFENGAFADPSPDPPAWSSNDPDWVTEKTKNDEERNRNMVGGRWEDQRRGGSWGGSERGRGGGGGPNRSFYSQQGDTAGGGGDRWQPRNNFSGNSGNDAYSRFNENRGGGGGRRKEHSDQGDSVLDRSGWSSTSSWAVRRTLPADVQDYYSRRERGGRGGGGGWNRPDEEQTAAADPPKTEPVAQVLPGNAPVPAVLNVMPSSHQPPLLHHPYPVAGGGGGRGAPLQPAAPYAMAPQVPSMHLHPAAVPLLQGPPGAGAQGLPPPPPPPPPMQQGSQMSTQQAHPDRETIQMASSLASYGKPPLLPTPTKAAAPPTGHQGGLRPSSASQALPSSTTQPAHHGQQHKAPQADSSKLEKRQQIQERAVNEVKNAMKPYYQKKEITKDEYKEIVRKAVEKVCHSKSGEVNSSKVANLVKAYVDKYKHARKK